MNRIAKFLMLAVAVVAMGAATATAATLITGKQVKDKSLTGKDVKPKSLAVKHLSLKARTALKGQAGLPGAPGEAGAPGAAGAKGEPGAKGDTGATGATGAKGDTGTKGETGAKGDTGAQGIQGARGPSSAYTGVGGAILVLNPANSLVSSREVPQGSYTVFAKMVLSNGTNVVASPDCELGVIRGDLFESLDTVDGVKVGVQNSATERVEITLMGAATVDDSPTNNAFRVRCELADGQSLLARDRKIILTQVAELK